MWSRYFVAALATMLSGCPAPPDGPRFYGAGNKTPVYGGTFVSSWESGLRTLDPHKALDEISVAAVRLLFDGLLDYDNDAHLIPSLAVALPEASADGKVFRFRLHEGVRFHNGREITAEDVRWSMERMLHPEVASPGAFYFPSLSGLAPYRENKAKHISGIRVVGKYEIEFRLDNADQTFLNAMALTLAYPVPRENYENGTKAATFHPIGSGAYVFGGWERGVRVVFRKNAHYWRKGLPYLDRIVYFENVQRGISVMRFMNGDTHHIDRLPLPDYLFFKKAKKWKESSEERADVDIWGLTMNCELFPFTNVHIRRAVSYAIDRERWSRARNHRLLVTGQALPPQLLGYKKDLPSEQKYDLRRAREEMRLAGYPKGLPEEVTMWVTEASTGRSFVAELAQADLAKIGVKLRIKQVSFPIYLQETGKRRTVQLALSGWSQDFPDPADFLDILFHTRSIHDQDSENRSFYSNPELDRLLDIARAEQDRAKRRVLYEQASQIVARDAPWAFLWNDLRFEAWQPYVRDFVGHPVWSQHYKFVWLDLPIHRVAMRDWMRVRPHTLMARVFFPFGERP